jgi:fumarate hydratase subunit beta
VSVITASDGIKDVTTPLSDDDAAALKAGDRVRITGVIYTGRDAAHGRLLPLIEQGEKLPIDVRGQIIYYTGPSPARPGDAVGSIGPTTASRMDKFTPALLKLGLKGTIGKGYRSQADEDLGTEAIRRLEVEGFPAIVLYDSHGGDLYQDGQKQYAREDA